MSVQAFGPELSVEAFNEGIVSRFAGAGEVQNNTLLISPQIEITRDELAAIIDTNGFWIPDLTTHAFECLNHILTAIGEARIGWGE